MQHVCVVLDDLMCCVWPVSYTHLDVYKRQFKLCVQLVLEQDNSHFSTTIHSVCARPHAHTHTHADSCVVSEHGQLSFRHFKDVVDVHRGKQGT